MSTGTLPPRPRLTPAEQRVTARRTAGFLAGRSLRLHRRAWAAVFAALVLTSLLLGGFALATLSTVIGHPRVERYAATTAVVAGNQETTHTASPWGSRPQTLSAALTERVPVPRSVVPLLEAVPGVRAAIPDDAFPVALTGKDGRPVHAPGGEGPGHGPTYGHGWSAAELAPFTLRSGSAPSAPDQVVLDGALARQAGVEVGDWISLSVFAEPHRYQVAGVAAPEGAGDAAGLAHQGAVFFSDERARTLAGDPEYTDVVGVLADSGVSVHELYPLLREALDTEPAAQDGSAGARAEEDSSALRVLTGNDRGGPEFLDAEPSRAGLLMLLVTVCAVVVMIAVLVVSSTVAQAVHQRAGELALLRAVGSTPRQVRAVVGQEVRRVALAAALLGGIGAVPVFLLLVSMLSTRGAIPEGLELPAPPWMLAVPLLTAGLTLLVARSAASIACGRTARTRPALAVGEARHEPAQPGRGRTVAGVILLFAGLSSAGTAAFQYGELAAAAASTAAMALVIACALLGPWIARGALHVLGGPVGRLGGAGHLAAAACRTNARRLGAAITPIVLVVAFVGVQLSAGATLDRQGGGEARQAMRADLAVTTEGPGLPDVAARAVGGVPGVAAVTGVQHSTVVLAHREFGEPRLDRLPVLGVAPAALPDTLDPGLAEGDFQRLGEGTVAVGKDRARSLGVEVGSEVTLRFGDGAAETLEVVAVYERSLALGEFLLAHDELGPHLAAPLHTRLLLALAPDADGPTVRAAVEEALATAAVGARVEQPDAEHLRTEDWGVGQVITAVAVTVIGAFTTIAVLSTLTLITVGRRPELRLLRLAGAGRRQTRRMLRIETAIVAAVGVLIGALAAAIPLTAFSLSLTGSLPYLPPAQAGLVVAVAVGATAAGTLLPARGALREKFPGRSWR